MNETVRAQYPLVLIIYALNLLTKVKKIEIGSLLDYVARSKTNRDVTKIHLGKGVLEYFIENSEPYINEKMSLFENP